MALFRSIPHEVEAVQFKGLDEDMIPTFSEGFDTLPRWALKVAIRPHDHGLFFAGTEGCHSRDLWLVNVSDWIVFGFGGGIRIVADSVMSGQYTPARKRMFSSGDVGTAKAEPAETTVEVAAPEPVEAVEVAAPEPEVAAEPPKPEDFVWVEVADDHELAAATA